MDRNDKRNAVILFRQNPAKMAVPRVTMHQVGIDVCGVEINATAHCAESGAQRFWAGETARVELEPDDLEVAFFETLIAKATHFHRHRFRQFAREIAHMYTRAAVNVRRILVREKENFHVSRVEQASGLLSTEFASGTARATLAFHERVSAAHLRRRGCTCGL